MSNQPVVSLIVPVYKVEAYLRRCVDSILGQTFRDFELILVDDGSPDRCGEICDGYARKDSRVVVVHNKENRGLLAVRHIGVNAARGKWIAFVDSDDAINANRLENMVTCGEASGADAVWGDIVSIFDGEAGQGDKMMYHPFSGPLSCTASISGREFLERMLEAGGCDYEWHVVWAKIYRREVAIRAAGIVGRNLTHLLMCEDVVWSAAFACSISRLAFSHGSVYFYYRNTLASTSSQSADRRKLEQTREDMEKSFKMAADIVVEYGDVCDVKVRYDRWRACYARDWMAASRDRYPEISASFADLAGSGEDTRRRMDGVYAAVSSSNLCSLHKIARCDRVLYWTRRAIGKVTRYVVQGMRRGRKGYENASS